jgi:hypothetical protein
MFFCNPNNFKAAIRTVIIVLMVTVVSSDGFAVDNLIDGGKRSKSFSTIKTDLQFSFRSGFHFQNYKLTSVKRTSHMVTSNYFITYHRGNVTMAIPYKGKSKFIQKFKTPER